MKSCFLICALFLIALPLWSDSQNEILIPLGLPSIRWPEDNLYNSKKAELGSLLYFDARLSSDGTISCASCHAPSETFSDRRPLSIGIKGKKVNVIP